MTTAPWVWFTITVLSGEALHKDIGLHNGSSPNSGLPKLKEGSWENPQNSMWRDEQRNVLSGKLVLMEWVQMGVLLHPACLGLISPVQRSKKLLWRVCEKRNVTANGSGV